MRYQFLIYLGIMNIYNTPLCECAVVVLYMMSGEMLNVISRKVTAEGPGEHGYTGDSICV